MRRILTLILTFISASVWAAAGDIELNYGGRLTNVDGSPKSGPVELEVKFYRSAAGNDVVPITIPNFTNVALG